MPCRPLVLTVCALAVLVLPAVARADVPTAPPPAAAGAPSVLHRMHLPPLTKVRLENGLTLVLEEDHHAPFVAMRLAYPAGWASDPPEKLGLAALTQRLMTMTTKHVPDHMYERWLDRVGATDRGWRAVTDWTSIWATVPTSAVPTVLWLWSDQMGFFAPEESKLLVEARGTSRNQHVDWIGDAAYGGVPDIELRALYPEGHPYHATFSAAAIDRMTAEDVRGFHDRYFGPSGAVLALSGDFVTADVVEQVRRYFGTIPSSPLPTPTLSRNGLGGSTRLDVAANVKAPAVYVSWRTPALLDAGDAELDVASLILAGPRFSAIGWDLINGRMLATNVTARQSSRALGSFFEIRALVADGHTPDEVIAAIDFDLARASRGSSDEAILETARTRLVPRLQELDSLTRRTDLYAEYTFVRHDPDWLANDLDRFDAVAPGAVRAAMKRWLGSDRRVVIVVTPDPSAPRSGELRSTQAAAP